MDKKMAGLTRTGRTHGYHKWTALSDKALSGNWLSKAAYEAANPGKHGLDINGSPVQIALNLLKGGSSGTGSSK
jgi:hypothetical protein